MKLMLVLLLLILPSLHLITHLLRMGIDIVLKTTAFLLNVFHLTVEFAFHLQHLLLND